MAGTVQPRLLELRTTRTVSLNCPEGHPERCPLLWPWTGSGPESWSRRPTGSYELILFPHKNPLFPTIDFYPLFLNEDGRFLKNGLSKLHYRFRRYSTLTKTVLLESQYLKSYGSIPDFLRPKFEEDRHNFADIEIQAKLS